VRYTAARKAKRASVSRPTPTANGVSHGAMKVSANPARPSVRRTPAATAPTQTPRSTGVTTLAMANIVPHRRWVSLRSLPYERKVNAEPRSTMPMSMSESGMCSAMPSAANAGGKQVKRRTTTMMSQTWFASQMGPMAWAMSER
jgi:hypothetical protein